MKIFKKSKLMPGIIVSLLFMGACSSGETDVVGAGSNATPLASEEAVFAKSAPHALEGTSNNGPGIIEPVSGKVIPNTDQVEGDVQKNLGGPVITETAVGATSLTGHIITSATSPNDDMRKALRDINSAATSGDKAGMITPANELMDILLGRTQGKIYDGFPMLNYNSNLLEAIDSDFAPGEYKMKTLRDTGKTALGLDPKVDEEGNEIRVKVWEVDVNMLWYDGQFDADTFLIKVPFGAKEDLLHVNYNIYSLVREEFAPATVMLDKKTSVALPYKGLDSVWVPIEAPSVTQVTVKHPPLGMLRGVYTWGWREHPPRIHFLQPVFEIVNAHTGDTELDPQGRSFAERNKLLSIAWIGEAAPEKKMYNVAQAVINGSDAATVYTMLHETSAGTWQEWADLTKNQKQLPPEAWKVLHDEDALSPGDFGDYRFVSVYMNNEMYGAGPKGGGAIEKFTQGEMVNVKIINLDKQTHFFRNVDFSKPLHDDISKLGNGGSHSFEIFNFKPTYGAPKVAEMQWRAGWGFRPHFDVIQQPDVFPAPGDLDGLLPFIDGKGNRLNGYQFSTASLPFRFNPPPFIIGKSFAEPSSQRLQEPSPIPGESPSNGLVIGQLTEGYGVAKMCSREDFPTGFCGPIPKEYNPNGALNFPPPPSGMVANSLRFPPFLRNPNTEGGDIIPPTPIWKPFLWINPNNGTLFLKDDTEVEPVNPTDPATAYWADRTYAHGRPIPGGTSLDATVEAPRASGEIFYQFDDLFHDNAIFSPHAR